MKNSMFFLIAIIATLTFTTGCSSTPRSSATSIAYAPASTRTNTPSFSQNPERLEIANAGREYKRHVREAQKARLESDRNLAAIERRAREQQLARELGVEYNPDPLPTREPVQQPVVYAPTSGSYTLGQPYQGGQWYNFFGIGGGHGSYVFGGAGAYGTVGGGGRINRQPHGRLFGVNFRQSTPGYRHTGGPGTIVNTYSLGGGVQGGAGVNSGLTFGGP